MNADQIREIIRQELAAFFASGIPRSQVGDDLMAVIAAQGPAAGMKFAQEKLRQNRKRA